MAGINYGNSYTRIKSAREIKKVGVSYAELADKWVVRIKLKKSNNISTIAGFKTKEEADLYYNSLETFNK